MPRTLVVIPAYNEAAHIGSVVAEVRSAAPGYDVAVVDDGSTDATAELAASAGARVISHPFNLGYGVALQTGYRFAVAEGYEIAVQMDADGQHRAADLRGLTAPIEAGRADVVYGTRFHPASRYRMTPFRRLGSRWFALLIERLTGWRSTDPTTGFQALSLPVLEFYGQGVFPNDYPDADVLVLLLRNGFRVVEAPVSMDERPSSEAMHRGLGVLYYVYKMTLALLMNAMRSRERT